MKDFESHMTTHAILWGGAERLWKRLYCFKRSGKRSQMNSPSKAAGIPNARHPDRHGFRKEVTRKLTVWRNENEEDSVLH